MDADVEFANPRWVDETKHQLQKYRIVQMFSHAQDISPTFDLGSNMDLRAQQGFMYSYVNGVPLESWRPVGIHLSGKKGAEGYYGAGAKWWLWHCGYAWAARRSAFNDLGGLGDIAILGSADHHVAAALIGEVQDTIHGDMQDNYKAYWQRWQDRAEKYIKRDVGYVPGLLLHHWHGPKKNRQYTNRWKILTEEKYDYEQDLYRDFNGLYALTDRNIKLRDRIRRYFEERQEDDIRLD